MDVDRHIFLEGSYLALSGGVGGAKLALGLSHILEESLSVVCNTGDDFSHLGLKICPDLDTVMYTLADLNDKNKGWGLANESWNFLDAMKTLGHDNWFQLGDKDLATHVTRTQLLDKGKGLSEVTQHLCTQLGIKSLIFPMSDQNVATKVGLKDGSWIPFQHYFVKEQCAPEVRAFKFDGINDALPGPALEACLKNSDLKAIFICPSNPFVSIDPILSLHGVSTLLKGHSAPVIAVSPIVGGQAIKGPTAKIMSELEITQSAFSVAEHYASLLDGYVLDEEDHYLEKKCQALGIDTHITQTVMNSLEDKINLASECLNFSKRIIESKV